MSADTELWVRETGDLAPLLPRADEWDAVDDAFELDGGGWLVTVMPPEPADPDDVPPELVELVDGLRFRVELAVDPAMRPRTPGPCSSRSWHRSASSSAAPRSTR